jgi:hypothetical protein
MEEPFYSWPEGVAQLAEEFRKRGWVAIHWQSEYGPTIAVIDSSHRHDLDEKYLESIKGDFNQYWATAKKPEWLMTWMEDCEYWWSFD